MKTRTLGLAGFEVGAIGLGCMGMSFAYSPSSRDDARSARVIHEAIDLGMTLIDTADVYGPHTNEELVGRAVRSRLDEIVLASKCGLVIENDQIVPDGRPEHIVQACDGSLRRLGVEVIDLYQLHRVDPRIPVEETWGAMAALVTAGKVRHIGMSEVTVDQLTAAQTIHPVATVQSELSLWSQDQLTGVVPWCAAHGAAFIAYSPLGRGFLTGSITSADQLEHDDWRTGNPRFQADTVDANQRIAEAVAAIAARHQAKPAQVALAWVLQTGGHVIPIPGTTRPEHLAQNAAAAALELSEEDIRFLGDLGTAVAGTRY